MPRLLTNYKGRKTRLRNGDSGGHRLTQVSLSDSKTTEVIRLLVGRNDRDEPMKYS